jgi:hypothetical protein
LIPLAQQSSKPKSSPQSRGTSPLIRSSFPSLHANRVQGISVDAEKTHRIDQIFTVKDGVLHFGVPVSSDPLSQDIATGMGKSLEPGVVVPGLVCKVPFDECGFGVPEFSNVMLENVDRMTPEDFGVMLQQERHPELLKLEQALHRFHEQRTSEVLPWVYSDPYEAVMGEPRQPKIRESAVSRGNGYVADLSVLMHHLAGSYLQAHGVEALFIGRTVRVLSGEQRFKIHNYAEFLNYVKHLEVPSDLNLSISPLFWTTKPIVHMGEGGGGVGGIVAPCTCPLRSLTARINVRILSMVAAGITPQDPTEELKAIAALRNAEMRLRQGAEGTARAVRLQLIDEAGEVQSLRQVPNRPAPVDTIAQEKELLRYHEQCNAIVKMLLSSRPHPAHIAFAIEAFDRSRKDWSKVRHAVLLWLKAMPDMVGSVAELLRISSEEPSLQLPTMLTMMQATRTYFEGLPYKARGFHCNDLPDVYARSEKQFARSVDALLSRLGIAKPRYQLNRARTFLDERGRVHRLPNMARATLTHSGNTYFSEWCQARQLKTAQHKAAASLLRNLLREGVVPWELVKNPDVISPHAAIVPVHHIIQRRESNSKNWQQIRSLHPLMVTFDLIMYKQGWQYEIVLSEDLVQSETRHLMLKIFRENKEDVVIETVRGNALSKRRDAMRRALRYYMSELSLEPSDLTVHQLTVIGRIEQQQSAAQHIVLFVDGIAAPIQVVGGNSGVGNHEMVEAHINFSKRKKRYYARILRSL